MNTMGETLIRTSGLQQAADINALFGFRIECIERLGDPHGIWAWTRLNALFNWLPLAASIEDKILCMHGGGHSSLLLVPPELIILCRQFSITNLMHLLFLHLSSGHAPRRPDLHGRVVPPHVQASAAASTAWTR